MFKYQKLTDIQKEIIVIIFLFINFKESGLRPHPNLLLTICNDIIHYLKKIHHIIYDDNNIQLYLQETIQLLCLMNISDDDLSLNPSANIEKNKLLQNYNFIMKECPNLYRLFKRETITKIEKEIEDRKKEELKIKRDNEIQEQISEEEYKKENPGLISRAYNYLLGPKKVIKTNKNQTKFSEDKNGNIEYDAQISNAPTGTGGRRTKRRSIRRTKRRRMRSRRHK